MGKAYANRLPIDKRPEADFYSTPASLFWELEKHEGSRFVNGIYDPAAGSGQLLLAAAERGIQVSGSDLYPKESTLSIERKDFLALKNIPNNAFLITNPPFSQFDDFVRKAKELTESFIMLGKTNFFGAYKRHREGIWENLSDVYVFNRQVDYRTPDRNDGLFFCGNLVTGWFVWDREAAKRGCKFHILDVQPYASLLKRD